MSLTNLGLNQGSMLHIIFVIFLCMLKILLLVFLCLTFLYQQESSPKVVKILLQQQESNPKVADSIQYFHARFEVWNLYARFQNRFYSFPLYSIPLIIQLYNRCSFPYNILRRSPMVSIRCFSGVTGIRDPYTIVFIQYVNCQETMANDLWYHGLDTLCRNVHTTAQVYIPPITDR